MITRKYYLNHLNYLSSLLLWTVFFDIPNIMSDMIENWSNDFDFKSKCSESSHYLFSFDIERWIICDVDDGKTRNYGTTKVSNHYLPFKIARKCNATVENLYKVNDSICSLDTFVIYGLSLYTFKPSEPHALLLKWAYWVGKHRFCIECQPFFIQMKKLQIRIYQFMLHYWISIIFDCRIVHTSAEDMNVVNCIADWAQKM